MRYCGMVSFQNPDGLPGGLPGELPQPLEGATGKNPNAAGIKVGASPSYTKTLFSKRVFCKASKVEHNIL